MNWRKKATELAKKIVRSRGVCEFCGTTEGQMQGSHIFPDRGYPQTAADLENILCLCAKCHKWDKHSWHKGIEIQVWFYTSHSARYLALYTKSHSEGVPDFEEIYCKLLKELA